MLLKRTGLAVAILLAFAVAARAEDAYYRLQLKDLEITEGKLPATAADVAQAYSWGNWRLAEAVRPYAVVDGKGEVYLEIGQSSFRRRAAVAADPNADADAATAGLFIRAPKGTDVTGLLFLPKTPDENGRLLPPKPGEDAMVRLKFKVSAKLANDKFAKDFYQQKAELLSSNARSQGIPGGAWFRHELRSADARGGKNRRARKLRVRKSVRRRHDEYRRPRSICSVAGGRWRRICNLIGPCRRPRSRSPRSRFPRSKGFPSPRSIGRS